MGDTKKVTVNCATCGREVEITKKHYLDRTRWGHKKFYCPKDRMAARKKANIF